MGQNRVVRELLSFPLEFLRLLPGIALIPFMILWFGTGAISQMGVLLFYVSAMMTVYTYEATRNIPPIYSQFALTLGASPRTIFSAVTLPAVMPEVLGGLRAMIAFALGGEVVTELAGASEGMGRVFLIWTQYFRADSIMAGLIWIALAAVVLDRVLVLASRPLLRWVPREQQAA
jgi:ABC-type nitrate/sulfonate/bicarbonate transport system permease component